MVAAVICNNDCLQCTFPDCINDRPATQKERAFSKSLDTQILLERAPAAFQKIQMEATEDEKEKRRSYYLAHKEEIKERSKARYREHREELKAVSLRRYHDNKKKGE